MSEPALRLVRDRLVRLGVLVRRVLGRWKLGVILVSCFALASSGLALSIAKTPSVSDRCPSGHSRESSHAMLRIIWIVLRDFVSMLRSQRALVVEIAYEFADVFNGDTFWIFLMRLVRRFAPRKVFLIIDNAPFH